MKAFEFILILVLILVICSMATLNRWHVMFQTQWGNPLEQMEIGESMNQPLKETTIEYPDESIESDKSDDCSDKYSELPVTRIEFIVTLSRYLGLIPEKGPLVFTDIAPHSPARRYIYPLVKRGYISGYPDNTLRPQEFITENEAAIIIARSQGKSGPLYRENSPLLTKKQLFIMFSELN